MGLTSSGRQAEVPRPREAGPAALSLPLSNPLAFQTVPGDFVLHVVSGALRWSSQNKEMPAQGSQKRLAPLPLFHQPGAGDQSRLALLTSGGGARMAFPLPAPRPRELDGSAPFEATGNSAPRDRRQDEALGPQGMPRAKGTS